MQGAVKRRRWTHHVVHVTICDVADQGHGATQHGQARHFQGTNTATLPLYSTHRLWSSEERCASCASCASCAVTVAHPSALGSGDALTRQRVPCAPRGPSALHQIGEKVGPLLGDQIQSATVCGRSSPSLTLSLAYWAEELKPTS